MPTELAGRGTDKCSRDLDRYTLPPLHEIDDIDLHKTCDNNIQKKTSKHSSRHNI